MPFLASCFKGNPFAMFVLTFLDNQPIHFKLMFVRIDGLNKRGVNCLSKIFTKDFKNEPLSNNH